MTFLGFSACGVLYYHLQKLKSESFKNKERYITRDSSIYGSLAMYYKNPILGIEIMTPALQKMIGAREKLDLEQLRDFFRSDNPGVLGSLLNQVYEGSDLASEVLRIPSRNRVVRCNVKKVPNTEGRLEGILLVFEEINNGNTVRNDKKKPKSKKEAIDSLLRVLNNAPYPIWERDPSHKITYANLTYMKMLGEQLHNINQPDGMELFSGGKKLAEEAIIHSDSRTERQHIVINGERKLYKITEVPTSHNMTMGFARDISEQEWIEGRLEKNVEAQSHFLETSTNATAIFGPDKKLQFFNSSYAKLWDMEDKWLEQNPSYGEVLDKLREKRKLPEQADFKFYRKKELDKFNNLIDPSEELLYLPDGKVLRVITVAHESGGVIFAYEDITDKLALEQSYNTLIAVKKATIDNLHEGVSVFREDGRMNLYNPVYAEIWQLEDDFLNSNPHISEILEQTKFLYEYKGKWEKFKENMIKSFIGRKSGKQRLVRKDGSVLDWTSVALPDGNTLMTYTDITDSFLVEKSLRAEKEALEEADNLKSKFLANVSYELRSPLTSIRGFSEALLHSYFGHLNDKQKEYMEGIYASSVNLSMLINDILDMASIDAGYMKLDIEEFDLYKMITELGENLKNTAKAANRNLTIECPPETGSISADKHRISQVVTNLVNYAILQTADNGNIAIKIEPSTNKVRLIVVNDGAEIDPREQQDIFKQFYKAHNETQETGATALALPIVKSFVELHGGSIKLESEAGKGTKITCTLRRNLGK